MIIVCLKNERKNNFFQSEVVRDDDLQINGKYDGIMGLNILKESKMSLVENYLSLKYNNILIPMNEKKLYRIITKATLIRQNYNLKEMKP